MSVAWHESNRRYLDARIALLRERLEACARGETSAARLLVAPEEQALDDLRSSMEIPPALDKVAAAFGLSEFETSLLLLCAAVEIDDGVAELCATLSGSPDARYATFAIAFAAFDDPHWSAVTPAAALRRWQLIETRGRGALLSTELRVDERVLHFVLGVSYAEPRLSGIIEPAPGDAYETGADERTVRRIVELAVRAESIESLPVLNLCSDDGAAADAVAARASAAMRLGLHQLRAADVPQQPAERELLARLWEREAALTSAALLISGESSENTVAVAALAGSIRGVVFVSSRDPVVPRGRAAVRIDVPRPSAAEQANLWREALGPDGAHLEKSVDELAQHFRLGAGTIRDIARDVRAETHASPESLARALWDASRTRARMRLDALAQRLEPAATWNDIVLPAPLLEALREIAAHVRQRATVYDRWGFSRQSQRGLGISALFCGPSGTGKTMAAEVIANELRLDLYRVDLSQVVSKYIGETEKNLSRIFDASELSGAVLLFDEADTLFGRRSEVRDSHDRYANLEIGYLLQRMEEYRGLAILTTNFRSALDAAFLRRLRFVLNFPFPDSEQRAEIWQRVFPAAAPVEGVDVGKLARLNIAGGNIRNIALHAAFLAAEERKPIGMVHLRRAAHVECAKLDKPPMDLGAWT